MEKTGPESGTVPGTAECVKDKRTLVLFLLGLLLIVFDLFPVTDRRGSRFDQISPEKGAHQWQLPGGPVAVADAPDPYAAFVITQLVPEYQLVPDPGVAADTVPAALFPFFNKPLPINRAGKETLEMLPGIGPHLAVAIADTLQRQGTFTGPDDLLKVPGIGPKSLERLLPLISFE